MSACRVSAFAATVVALVAGCGEQHFRSETEWHADGSVERAVYQPAETLPEPSSQSWAVVRPEHEIKVEGFSGSIRELPAGDTGDAPYVAAWGKFASVDALPDSLKLVAPDESKASRLERRCKVTDLGLATEYRWDETLTDVVSLADMAVARRETAAIIADLVESTLRDGPLRYDITGLLKWLRIDALHWFDETHAALVEAMLRQPSSGQATADRLFAELADISAKYGLTVRKPDGSLMNNDEFRAAVGRFLLDKVRETVVTPAGKPVNELQSRELLAQLGVTGLETVEWNPSPDWTRAVLAHFETEDAAQAKAKELTTRLFGAYQLGFLSPRRRAHYELKMPGSIIESTGERISDSRVVWRFEVFDAFPLGYSMSARSLSPNDAVQKKLLGDVRLKSLEHLAEYTSMMRADASMLTMMQQCSKAGSLKPFDDYESNMLSDRDVEPAVVKRFKALRRLLK